MKMLDEFLDLLDDSPFEEIPVDVVAFVEGAEYLNQPPLSPIQYDIVEAMSQVYYLDDLKRVMSAEKAEAHYNKYTKKEVILRCGKGSTSGADEVFDANTGKWARIDSLQDSPNNYVLGSEDGSVQSQYSTEAFCEGYDMIYNVKLERGLEINVTRNHAFYNEDFERVQLKDLSIGKRIAVCTKTTVNNPVAIDSLGETIECIANGVIPDTTWSLPDNQLLEVLEAVGTVFEDETTAKNIQRLWTRLGQLATLDNNRIYLNDVSTGDFYFARIESVEEVMPQPVFTMTAVDTHNFVANLVLNGNSGK
jgi:hypothetical protein